MTIQLNFKGLASDQSTANILSYDTLRLGFSGNEPELHTAWYADNYALMRSGEDSWDNPLNGEL